MVNFFLLPFDIQKYVFEYKLMFNEKSIEGMLDQMRVNSLVCKTWKTLNQSEGIWQLLLDAFKKKYPFTLLGVDEKNSSVSRCFQKLYLSRTQRARELIQQATHSFIIFKSYKGLNGRQFKEKFNKESLIITGNRNLMLLFEMARNELIPMNTLFNLIVKNF